MLAALIRFAGFDRPPPIPLPPKARRTAPAQVARTAKPVSDNVTVMSDTLSDEIAQARAERQVAAPKTARPLNAAQAVVAIARVHGGFSAERAWYHARSHAELDAAARDALGAELHSYCRALYLTGSKPPHIDRRLEFDEAYVRRLVVNLGLDCTSDIDVWEKAMHLVSEEQKRQHRAGRPITPSLSVPEAVLTAIAARQAERAARLERSRGGRGGGTPTGSTASGESGGGVTLEGGKGPKDDDGGSAPPAPPPGPQR